MTHPESSSDLGLSCSGHCRDNTRPDNCMQICVREHSYAQRVDFIGWPSSSVIVVFDHELDVHEDVFVPIALLPKFMNGLR